MTDSHADRGFSCTLDGPAFRLREDQFRELFARTLRTVGDVDARSARLLFDDGSEAELRDLLEREARCCSFFEFDIGVANDCVSLRVSVPEGSEHALAFLLNLAAAARA